MILENTLIFFDFDGYILDVLIIATLWVRWIFQRLLNHRKLLIFLAHNFDFILWSSSNSICELTILAAFYEKLKVAKCGEKQEGYVDDNSDQQYAHQGPAKKICCVCCDTEAAEDHEVTENEIECDLVYEMLQV